VQLVVAADQLNLKQGLNMNKNGLINRVGSGTSAQAAENIQLKNSVEFASGNGIEPSKSGGMEQVSSEVTVALGQIISAFVDLGFGNSAAQQSQRAANDNRCLQTLAEELLS